MKSDCIELIKRKALTDVSKLSHMAQNNNMYNNYYQVYQCLHIIHNTYPNKLPIQL